jgi:hypothetical protein
MQCETLVSEYLKYLRDGFYCEPRQHGYVLTTPYRRPDNDAIEVYVDGPSDAERYVLSDKGETLYYLGMFGPDFLQSRQRALHFHRVLRSHGAELVDDEIRMTAVSDQLAITVDRFVHALHEVSNLSHLIHPVARGTFREQVSTYFRERRIPAIENYELDGATARWSVDFYVNSTANLAIEVITASTPGYAQSQLSSTFVKVFDLKQAQEKLRAVALLDDQDGKLQVWPPPELAMLGKFAEIVYWNDRTAVVELAQPRPS